MTSGPSLRGRPSSRASRGSFRNTGKAGPNSSSRLQSWSRTASSIPQRRSPWASSCRRALRAALTSSATERLLPGSSFELVGQARFLQRTRRQPCSYLWWGCRRHPSTRRRERTVRPPASPRWHRCGQALALRIPTRKRTHSTCFPTVTCESFSRLRGTWCSGLTRTRGRGVRRPQALQRATWGTPTTASSCQRSAAAQAMQPRAPRPP
mmetsp:Transcript_21526/g.49251  ORF Transcript_21526/g.49251 Transcript_21526/m.49251 type:complete len:209 (-) Transcript_21526:55-681(-)